MYSSKLKIAVAMVSLLAAGPVAGAEPIFTTFEDICLSTASYLDRITDRIRQLPDWEAVPPSIKFMTNSRAWYLSGNWRLGYIAAGDAPFAKRDVRRTCTLSMPRGQLTLRDAEKFLLAAGALKAHPFGKHDDRSPMFAISVEKDMVLVGVHLLMDDTVMQLVLFDAPEDEVRAAVQAAEAAKHRPDSPSLYPLGSAQPIPRYRSRDGFIGGSDDGCMRSNATALR